MMGPKVEVMCPLTTASDLIRSHGLRRATNHPPPLSRPPAYLQAAAHRQHDAVTSDRSSLRFIQSELSIAMANEICIQPIFCLFELPETLQMW